MKAGWEIKKLGEVCTIKGRIGFRGYTREDLVEHGEGAITLSPSNIIDDKLDLNKCQYISWHKYEESPEIMISKGDVIFAKTASIGKVAVVEDLPEKATINPQFVVFKNISCSNYFLYYAVRGQGFKHQIASIINGVAIPTVSQSNLSNLTIPIPPLSEQEQIVAELDFISGIIDKKKQQLKELDSLAQSIFYEMFGNPVENDKGWETAKVIDVVKLQRGYDLPTNDRVQSGDIPVWGSNGIVGYHNMSKIDFGIITGRSGTLGTVYSYDKPFFPLNTTLFSIDTHGNDIVYLRFLLNAYDLKRFGTGTGVPTLNRNTFHSEKIINVPLYLQQEFASKIESIEKQKELIKQSLQDTETLFNSRMNFYFN